MATKEEDGNDGFLGELRAIAQLLQDIISQVSATSHCSYVPQPLCSCSQGVFDDSDHDVGQGGENKLNSDETSKEQGTSIDHQLAGLSTTYSALLAYKKSDQVGDSDLAITKYTLPDDEEVTNPIDYTSSDYDLFRYQLQERFSQLSVENDDDSKEFAHDASLKQYMSRTDSSSSDHLEAEQSQYGTHEHASDLDVRQPVNQAPPPKPRLERQNAMRPQRYTSSDYDVVRYQIQELFSQLYVENDYSDDSSLKQYMSKIDSSSSDHLDSHEHTSGLTFDVRQPVNQAPPPPPKPRLQRQNAMPRQRHTRELDPGYSASYLNQPMPTRQSITTASSHGRMPSISMTKSLTTATDFVPQRNQQAMNPHNYSQCKVPSGQYGNITNSLYTPPNQNEGYNMPSAAATFQQHGGSNMAHNGDMMTSPYWRPEQQNDRYNMPETAASMVPYGYGASDNVGGSRFGYEGGVSRNHLPSIQQHQSGDSNVWPLSSRRSRQQPLQQLRSDFLANYKAQRGRGTQEGFLILKKKRENERERESFLFLLLACDCERKLAKMAAKDEDGNVNDDGDLAETRETDQMLEEIYSNRLLSRETSNEQGTSNQLATSNVPVSSGESVPEPSSSDLKNVEIKRPSMAEVVKMSLGSSSKENVTKAPAVKNDPSLHDKSSAATKPSSSNASTESDAIIREQLGDSDHGNLAESGEMDELLQEISDYVRLSQETSNEQGTSTTSNVPVEATSQPSSSDITNVETKSVASKMADAFETRYDLIIKESKTKAPVKNDRPLPDDEDVTNSIAYPSTELSKIDPSSSEHLEAEHVLYGTHEQVNQPMPTRQSITTTAPSPGRRPPISMTQAFITATEFVPQARRNQQAMNPHYSQYQFPSGQYGNITNSPYSPPSAAPFQQLGGSYDHTLAHYGNITNSPYSPPSAGPFQQLGGSYNHTLVHYGNITNSPYLPPSAGPFQQLGGSYNHTLVHYGNITNSPYWRAPEQNVSYNMPHLAASIVPYAYGSANLSGTWSDNNPANARFGYEAGVSTNNLPSIQQQHQGGDLNAWRPNEQHQQYWDDICASINQQNDRSGPSDQTQQRSPPRDN
ncbi:hypothetical protein Bca4012_060505 [Brassica carinata]